MRSRAASHTRASPFGTVGASVTAPDVPLASLRTGEFAISTHANGSENGVAFSTTCGPILESQWRRIPMAKEGPCPHRLIGSARR